jgi:large subunit ribosomal protein MRP49
MTVHFTDNASPATINMKHRRDSEILSQLLSIAKAFPVTPTPDELEQIRILEEQQALSERDSARHIAHNLAEKRKQDLLKQARSA